MSIPARAPVFHDSRQIITIDVGDLSADEGLDVIAAAQNVLGDETRVLPVYKSPERWFEACIARATKLARRLLP